MKQIIGLFGATALVAVNAFAMDVVATGTMMKHDDKMMATSTKMMDKMADKMEHKMMLTDEEAAKITGLSGKEKVMALQNMLIEKGLLKVKKGSKLGFYGPATRAAHMKMKAEMMKMMHDDKMNTASSTMPH